MDQYDYYSGDNGPDPYQLEGDMADYEAGGGDIVDYDFDSWEDDWWDDPVDDSGDWWTPAYDESSPEFGDFGLDATIDDDLYSPQSLNDDPAWLEDYNLTPEAMPIGQDEGEGLLGKLGISNKEAVSALLGLGKAGFAEWQRQQSNDRQDERDAEARAHQEYMARLAASLKKSGGGGGKAATIAAKTTDESREGDFTKRS